MSRADDDQSLIAMRDARMSASSIAFTMGDRWNEGRVTRRLAALDAEAARLAAGPVAPAAEAEAEAPEPAKPEIANPVRIAPLPEGEGLVTRTFALSQGGRGAAVVLGDRRTVFTETGQRLVKDGEVKRYPEPGDHLPVAVGEGVYQMVGDARG